MIGLSAIVCIASEFMGLNRALAPGVQHCEDIQAIGRASMQFASFGKQTSI